MSLPKRYQPQSIEPELQARWQQVGTYCFDLQDQTPVFSIDTPPATVSGRLHLGHTFSYSHPDFIARFWRMNGRNVFYPMGFDDNGLPTERLVVKQLGFQPAGIGREAFIESCLQLSQQVEEEYRELWQRLGLSIDWDYTYRTIDDQSRRIAQSSFLNLYQQGLAYRKEAPAIWCPECQTAIAQAELNDIDLPTEFNTLRFDLIPSSDDHSIPNGAIAISTTRPELLPACVAIFIHPQDDRYTHLINLQARVPLFGQSVPILADPMVDPAKGTGIVMCCTFGDQMDVAWWHQYNLPLVEAIDRRGCMTALAGQFEGLSIQEARSRILATLKDSGFWSEAQPMSHTIRVHERCDTPVEYLSSPQWFIRLLDAKDLLRQAGEGVDWYPAHMRARYTDWVENLSWDWCISRQRFFGVPFPVWYCQDCGEVLLASPEQLPVDPLINLPLIPCPACGCTDSIPDQDVMDTWATSSLTPQIVGHWLSDRQLYDRVFPFSLRAQAHEIIRTWAFYTLVQSTYHFDTLPWQAALISGWGIAAEGQGKISKSRGGGPMSPLDMIAKYSADALRYWAASTGPGKDAIISEEKIQVGMKLVNKIWHVSRFCSQFIQDFSPDALFSPSAFSPADRWILSRTQNLVRRVSTSFKTYEYAAAKAETETFFWHFADNYLEMAKQRLYGPDSPTQTAAQFTLYQVLLTLLKLFAPILPHVTEAVYLDLFASDQGNNSIHTSPWPRPQPDFMDQAAESLGETLVEIATLVRRYKSEHNLSLGTELSSLKLGTDTPNLVAALDSARPDLLSITRAKQLVIEVFPSPPSHWSMVNSNIAMQIEA